MHDHGSTDFLKSFALLFSDLGADLGGARNIFFIILNKVEQSRANSADPCV
jgi:hypothetical protein